MPVGTFIGRPGRARSVREDSPTVGPSRPAGPSRVAPDRAESDSSRKRTRRDEPTDPAGPLPMYARSIGTAAPPGSDVYEVFVRIRSRVSIGGQLFALLAEANVDVLGIFGQVDDDRLNGNLILYADYAQSKREPGAFLDLLRRQEYVVDARLAYKGRLFLEEMAFPPTSDGEHRVLIFPVEWWSSLVSGLVQQYGTATGAILHEQGLNAGRAHVHQVVARVPSADRELFLATLRAAGRTSGWGIFEIDEEGTAGGPEILRIVVREGPWVSTSPFSLEGCQFTVGFLRGALQEICRTDLVVRGLRYGRGALRFELVGVEPRPAEPTRLAPPDGCGGTSPSAR